MRLCTDCQNDEFGMCDTCWSGLTEIDELRVVVTHRQPAPIARLSRSSVERLRRLGERK